MTTTNKNKNVLLVTGSTGLIGSRVVSEFAGDHTVIGLDVEEPANGFEGDDWIKCDLTSVDNVNHALNVVKHKYGDQIAGVIHLAAYYDFSGEPSPLYRELTVKGTERLLTKLKEFTVEQFIYSSSLLVMKPVEEGEGALTENSETQAQWAYPQSKLAAEKILRQQHQPLPVVVLRLAGVYDEDCNCLPISQHIKRIYEKQPESYFFPGDADSGQPFIHLDDVVSCCRQVHARRRELEPYELFLIAEPRVLSHAELQDQLGSLLHGREWPTIRIPKFVAKSGAKVKEKLTHGESFIKPWMIDLADDDYPVQIDRASSRLEWQPQHRLKDTLPEMVRRFRQQPRAWYERHDLELPESLSRQKELAKS